MLPGPIFRVELFSAARRRRYFFIRVVYAAIILFVLWASYTGASNWAQYQNPGTGVSIRGMAQVAMTFFQAFIWVQLLGIIAVAPAMAVGTIATERERRTIEYLFTTDLSNLEIVLGKTFARLLLIGQLVLVSLPILFLFRLLGGVPANLLAASFLIAASTALFITALSVCVSVWSKRSRDATIRVYLVLAAILVLPIFLRFALMWPFGSARWWQDLILPVLDGLIAINPMWVLGRSMASGIALGVGFDFAPVLEMAGWHVALSVAMIALATAAVRRVHLRESTRGSVTKKDRPPRRTTLLPRWRPFIGDHPILWKEAFAATAKIKLGIVGGLAMFLIIITALGSTGYAFLYALTHPSYGVNDYYEYLAGFSGFVGPLLLLLVAGRAAGLITLEKERDCWVSLLSTPLTGGEIIRGKMLGNLYAVRWGFFLFAFAWMLGMFFNVFYLFIAALLMAMLVVLALFVTNVGLLYSLRSKTSLRAMGLTLVTVFFIGGGYLFCCVTVLAVGGGPGPDEEWMVGLAPCMPTLLAFPTVIFVELGRDNSYMRDEVSAMMLACVFGFFGYFAATMGLLHYMASDFDALAGRTQELPDATRREAYPRLDGRARASTPEQSST